MEEFIRRSEHDEFVKRMEDEHHRQSKRITEVEEAVKQYGALTVAVERMACNMQSMSLQATQNKSHLKKILNYMEE